MSESLADATAKARRWRRRYMVATVLAGMVPAACMLAGAAIFREPWLGVGAFIAFFCDNLRAVAYIETVYAERGVLIEEHYQGRLDLIRRLGGSR